MSNFSENQQIDSISCVSCGNKLTNIYCEQCGQRKQERFSLKYILGEILAILSLDRGYLYNFYYFTKEPTKTIQNYLDGKTKNFYPPFPYFITAITVFVLLISFAAHHIDIQFSKKFTFVLEDASIKAFYREQEYLTKKQQRIDRIYQLLENDTLREKLEFQEKQLLTHLYSDSTLVDSLVQYHIKEKAIDSLSLNSLVEDLIVEDKNYGEFVVKDLEKDVKSWQIVSYVSWYILPFYWALFSLLFYRKSKNYFTEHLVISLFSFAQIVWFVVWASVFGLTISWLYQQFYSNNLPIFLQQIQITLLWISLIYSFLYMFYIHWKVYKQHWFWALVKFIFHFFFGFFTMSLAAIFASFYLKG
jgi:hypothetical protein